MFRQRVCREKLEGKGGDQKKIGAANGQANELSVQRQGTQVYFRSQRMCLILKEL